MNNPEIPLPPLPLKKTQTEEYDLVILGGGTGSTVAAWTLLQRESESSAA